ncbi:class I SAM-dependent methyltransferase [Legionella pneumophila]|uniref:SAM-dependent methyltransferase n=1 Tax=Legionella pneumophila subsp. pascullei TaxID=91890 RepID=A0AAX2IWV6_LEGPN|nr:class I SAM-dependent methyltransferase [Legionella pneumophila]AMP88587.1 SAM-dependent methyltransferase [Legionella pneumophila subsp. pascullei]AMP91496.1 SAM-dependent methyltransferase [Legionella pneumophila subsp. pascullei]AMP94483.1 SAM-dependent methyltransferase [Legionella pneumophila subsp. pascullei]SQG89284.1 SAM-dependent methyltransferase [Legionella pneumophila subsp. pascullei]VEH04404.1 SAM-dependent methyltransferase [Legionella pneumophila subsp. pascullei]
MNKRNWIAYYNSTKQNALPRKSLLKAIANFDKEAVSSPKLAIDLGCGAGMDVMELLRRGWSVIAIDSQLDAIDSLFSSVQELTWANHLKTVVSSFETLNSLPKVSLINASFSLPFLKPVYFYKFWNVILRGLEPDGRFSGSFFGFNDSWNTRTDMTFLNREMICHLFTLFKIEYFQEEEKDEMDALGYYKHWHKFYIVAKKIV